MDILRHGGFTMGPLFATFLLGVTTIILLLWYSSRKQSFWKESGIPYVKPIPLLGSVLDNIRKPLQFIDLERFNKYGRIYGYYEGNQALLSVAEPEILRNILAKDFDAFTGRRTMKWGDKVMDNVLMSLRGEDWKRVRSILLPVFTARKLKRMMGIFNECSETLVRNFRDASEKGESIDARRAYSAFTMDTITNIAFSTRIDSLNDPNNKFVINAKHFFTSRLNCGVLFAFGIILSLFPGIMKLMKMSFISQKASEFLNNIVLKIIEERKRTGQTRDDFLQLLIDTSKETVEESKLDMHEKDDIAENYGKVESTQIFKSNLSKKYLSQDELVAQCAVFFVAAFETIASALTFVSHLLTVHPDIQERVIREVDDAERVNKCAKGELTYEAIQSMKYLDNVIAETLRLYPSFTRLERYTDIDYKLGNTGATVPKGTLVTVPIYALHRDPKLFPDPEKFDPDRFSPEERVKQVPYSYLPFGGGPRNCIAMRFALMQVKVCLAHVLSNFRIKKCPTTKVPLDFDNGLGFLLPKGISLLMEKRKEFGKEL